MPRKSRIDAPGALHHIIARGIERKSIFRDNKDRNNFLERLSDIIAGTETKCFAWSLMSNHVHTWKAKNLSTSSEFSGK